MLLPTLLLCLSPLGAPCAAVARETPDPAPNVLLVLVDDLGWGDLGCYGDELHRTPRIDALATEGARFLQAYANAPNCAPSRACLTTGQYAPRHGVYTVNSSARGRARDRRLVPVPNRTDLPEEAFTLAEAFRGAGYLTAHVGKWHLGEDPCTQGFELSVAGGKWGSPPQGYFAPFGLPGLERATEGEYLTERLTDEALAILAAVGERPFFLQLSCYAVHTPIQAVAELAESYRELEGGGAKKPAEYAAMVETVDRSVGRLLDGLGELGLAENTIVILLSDNGGHGSYTSPSALRGAKGMVYEGGIRVPLVVRWPGRIEGERQVADPVQGSDLFPTLVELCELELPEELELDGRSLAEILLADRTLRERPLFWHFPAYLEGGGETALFRTRPAGAVRLGAHKLIEFFEDGDLELYDLQRDPGETRDLSAELPELTARLHWLLEGWRAATDAPVPTEPEPRFVQPERATPAPNVLLILSDDQRPDALGAAGNPHVRTPHLDRLAARGTLFERAYCMGSMSGAVCHPSRAMIFSGRSLFRFPDPLQGEGVDSILLGEALRRAGYASFGTGKWHGSFEGFNRCFADGASIFFGGMGSHTELPVNAYDPEGRYPRDQRVPLTRFSSTQFVEEAIAFLDRHDGQRPFFVQVAFTAPHDPRTPPAEYLELFEPEALPLPANFLPEHPFDNGELGIRDEQLAPWPREPAVVREHLAAYYGMIAQMDAQIGRLLATLEERGWTENTLVVFASDHGLAIGSHGLLGKQNLYEHSMGTPVILAGPGVPAGGRVDDLVYLHDLYPTICELAGAQAPDYLDGRSLGPALRGEPREPRETIFTAYKDVQRALRGERWKVILYPEVDRVQLFDLAEDPHELRDLSARPEQAERLRSLLKLLADERLRHGDPLLPVHPAPAGGAGDGER